MRCFTRLPSVCVVLRDLYPFGGLSEIGATTPILGSALPVPNMGVEPIRPSDNSYILPPNSLGLFVRVSTQRTGTPFALSGGEGQRVVGVEPTLPVY